VTTAEEFVLVFFEFAGSPSRTAAISLFISLNISNLSFKARRANTSTTFDVPCTADMVQ
jgi:hypothetical protein